MGRPVTTPAIKNWASDLDMLYRLEQLILFTMRTETIQSLLCIPDECRSLLKKQIRTFAIKHGLKYVAPRGRARETFDFTTAERTALSVLLNMMQSTPDAGIDTDANGKVISTPVLDRMLTVYSALLRMTATNVKTAPVSFDVFTRAWQAERQGRAVSKTCDSCGGTHWVFLESPTVLCPICATLPLATLGAGGRRIFQASESPRRMAVAA